TARPSRPQERISCATDVSDAWLDETVIAHMMRLYVHTRQCTKGLPEWRNQTRFRPFGTHCRSHRPAHHLVPTRNLSAFETDDLWQASTTGELPESHFTLPGRTC